MIPSFCPSFTPETLAVKLSAKAESYVKNGHPWVFESSIVKKNKEGLAGDVAVIFDRKRNKYLGLGLYDPYSPIRIKMLLNGDKGKVDASFFYDKIKQAYAIRAELVSTHTNAFRWIYGENDSLPGLIVDVYHTVIVVKLYSAVWFPYLHYVVQAIIELYPAAAIVLRLSRVLQSGAVPTYELSDGQVIYGELKNSEVVFEEYGVKFIANVVQGHKTGYFLDHRHNRHKVGEMAAGKRVLDVFAYAGGFSTHAVVGGAAEVVSIDISKQALALASRNVQLNSEDVHHETMAMDAFEAMQSLIDHGRKFEIVVVDPPSFTKTNQDIKGAINAYQKLAALAIQLVSPGGMCVMASCSSRISRDQFFEAVEDGFHRFPISFRLLEKTFHDVDHPISFPEGAYLKTGYYQIS